MVRKPLSKELTLNKNLIVLDLEWNQSNIKEEAKTAELPFEIIEIGAIKCNEEKVMIGEFSELIKPAVYHEMHHITSKLIHMQIEELNRGRSFKVVMNEFLEWCGDNCIFCTWGPLDLTELQRNMNYYEMTPLSDGPIAFLDIQKIFSLAFRSEERRVGKEC